MYPEDFLIIILKIWVLFMEKVLLFHLLINLVALAATNPL